MTNNNVYNIADYIDHSLSKQEQIDVIINAIGLINKQLIEAKENGDYMVVESSRVATNEFIREWQSISGVV